MVAIIEEPEKWESGACSHTPQRISAILPGEPDTDSLWGAQHTSGLTCIQSALASHLMREGRH